MPALTIAQASVTLGVAQDTVRKRVRSGEIPATKEPWAGGFRWMVTVPESAQESRNNNGNNNGGINSDFGSNAGAAPPDLVDLLTNQVQDLRDQLTTRTREISELHQLLAARSLGPGVDRAWWQFWRK